MINLIEFQFQNEEVKLRGLQDQALHWQATAPVRKEEETVQKQAAAQDQWQSYQQQMQSYQQQYQQWYQSQETALVDVKLVCFTMVASPALYSKIVKYVLYNVISLIGHTTKYNYKTGCKTLLDPIYQQSWRICSICQTASFRGKYYYVGLYYFIPLFLNFRQVQSFIHCIIFWLGHMHFNGSITGLPFQQ